MAIDTSKLTEKQATWRMHLDRCRQRGVSLACYAEQENLSVHNLYYWKRVFAQKETCPSVAPSVAPASPFIKAFVKPTGLSRILFPNGICIELDHAVDSAVLAQLASLRVSA